MAKICVPQANNLSVCPFATVSLVVKVIRAELRRRCRYPLAYLSPGEELCHAGRSATCCPSIIAESTRLQSQPGSMGAMGGDDGDGACRAHRHCVGIPDVVGVGIGVGLRDSSRLPYR